jgi:hypothetical protein
MNWWSFGAPEDIRTSDPQIRSLLLYAITVSNLSASIVGAHAAERQTTFGNCNSTRVIPAPRARDKAIRILGNCRICRSGRTETRRHLHLVFGASGQRRKTEPQHFIALRSFPAGQRSRPGVLQQFA